ncbi:unnamed protein product [Gemmataceae bacterium]|nr:unnamed protein product [Gemmataceae bacterium]VTU00671.1 unnamed protein product [Gemmataceae bacterium]
MPAPPKSDATPNEMEAMNCQTVRNKILALPDPRHVPDAFRSHVDACAGCRAWAELAGRLEGLVAQLAAPAGPADKKAALLAKLRTQPATVEVAREEPATLRAWVKQNATLVGGLAAAVLVAFGAWATIGKNGPKPDLAEKTPRDPFLEKMVQRDVALARAATPAQKLVALGGLADDLSAEARGLARIASPDELKDVARWFDRVVKDGLVPRAKDLTTDAGSTPAERKAQLADLAARLGHAADEVKKASGEVPPDAKPVLERIADTARFGQKKLQDLAG